MPAIIPFKAYRYNPKKVVSMAHVLSPPYDVISKEEQSALYRKSPYNYVRLDLKKKSVGSNVYEETARDLKRWIRQRVLIPEEKDTLYVYRQTYRNLAGKETRRIGFFSLMKIDPSLVKKHEHTFMGPKKDRLALLKSLQANMSSIFGIFEDPKGVVHQTLQKGTRQKANIDVRLGGVRHELFLEQNPSRINRVKKIIKNKPMFIADGHHRFEVSLDYKRQNGREGPASYILTYLCAAEHNDLTIYPTHRVLKLKTGWNKNLPQVLKRSFDIQPFKSIAALERFMAVVNERGPVLGCAFRGGSSSIKIMALVPKAKTRKLDTIMAQEKVISKLISRKDVAQSKRMRFTRDKLHAIRRIKSGKADLAVFLSKIPISEVLRLSREGIMLPQKSTYFYPKLLSGMVIYVF